MHIRYCVSFNVTSSSARRAGAAARGGRDAIAPWAAPPMRGRAAACSGAWT